MMPNTRARIAAAVLGLTLIGILPGCSKPKQAPAPVPAPRPAPTAVQPAPPANPMRVTGLTVGRTVAADKSITERVDAFMPTDTFYASVRTEGMSSSATLMARWTFDGGQVVDESSQTIGSNGSVNYTEFHVSKPDGWPVGAYEVEILLNGTSVQRQSFRVN